MSDDLPTFERPTKATSAPSSARSRTRVAERRNWRRSGGDATVQPDTRVARAHTAATRPMRAKTTLRMIGGLGAGSEEPSTVGGRTRASP